jgi:hypothetical protein
MYVHTHILIHGMYRFLLLAPMERYHTLIIDFVAQCCDITGQASKILRSIDRLCKGSRMHGFLLWLMTTMTELHITAGLMTYAAVWLCDSRPARNVCDLPAICGPRIF